MDVQIADCNFGKGNNFKTVAIIHEMGKTYKGSYEDIEAITNALEFYPKAMANIKDEVIPDLENTHKHVMVHQAAGVAVAYLAWNFPRSTLDLKLDLHWLLAVV